MYKEPETDEVRKKKHYENEGNWKKKWIKKNE